MRADRAIDTTFQIIRNCASDRECALLANIPAMHAGEVPGIPPEYRGINYDVSSNFRDGDKSYSSPPRDSLAAGTDLAENPRRVNTRRDKTESGLFSGERSAPATGIFFEDSEYFR